MEAIAIVTILALIQFFVFSLQVGQARGKHGVKAPACSGVPEFERVFRVQQNTMEQLVVLLPLMWVYGYFGNANYAAIAGLVFIVGRFIYRGAYIRDPAGRQTGFSIGMLAIGFLAVAGLFAVGKDLYAAWTG